ncbi:MAG: hypothetical protein RR359_02885 [Bacilli bacterium]
MLSIIGLSAKIMIGVLALMCVMLAKQKEGQDMGMFSTEKTLKGLLIWGVLIGLSWL